MARPFDEEARMTDASPLAGQVAIVTGAGSGLGRAYALTLGALGASVVANDLITAEQAVTSVCSAITDSGSAAAPALASVADPDAGDRLVQAAVDAFGRLDIVIANAGVLRSARFPAVDDDNWRLHQSVHADAAFYLTRAAWPVMLSRDYGRIVLTTSSAGLFGAHGLTGYGASKMAVVGLLRVLAIEAADTGIRVNAIAPFASTPMSRAGGRTGSTAQILGNTFDEFDPELVSAAVAALSHPDCPAQGQVLAAGGGRVAEVVIAETTGIRSRSLTWHEILGRWDEIRARDEIVVPASLREELRLYARAANTHD
jgi:NAD(P)-dependent dehydrogenase (short-subunit alcohol dehydrogenase family)